MFEFLKRLRAKPAPPPDPATEKASILGARARLPANPTLPPAFQGYPHTYQSDAQQAGGTPNIFEPALAHFPKAFRVGAPAFESSAARAAWEYTRMQVLDRILELVSDSPWREHLVLRGSLTLRAWLINAARDPGDIDWVYRPKSVRADDLKVRQLFAEITQMVTAEPKIGEAQIDTSKISIDDIWTYERASGRRIVFPWKVEGLPPGCAQMDVVFGESLFADPVQSAIPRIDGGATTVWTASRELSLAWKLLWLETDMHPQGKDLYDATLLAEQVRLPIDLLVRVLNSGDWHCADDLQPDFPMKWANVDWENFKLEYPSVIGDATAWQSRLTAALAPTFAGG